MRITGIKCYVLPYTAAPMGFHWREGLEIPDVSGRTSHFGIVRVETDDGIVGHTGGGNGYHLAELTERFWKPSLVGENPLYTERLWHRLWELRRVGGGNVATMDQAFWDIKSQAAGLPLWQKLGGNDSRVPAYASTITWGTLAEYEQHMEHGHLDPAARPGHGAHLHLQRGLYGRDQDRPPGRIVQHEGPGPRRRIDPLRGGAE